jgi:3-hydroxyisobutyrate dehydrogenase-like beta-hydroxyacid dehydrogenase
LQTDEDTPVTTIAFLGLGRMGRPMAANLCAAGHRVVVWNRTSAKAEAFAAEQGARAAATPALCVAEADVVISMLSDDAAVVDAHTSAEGTFTSIRPGAVVVDMSTIAVGTVHQLAAAASAAGVSFLDAPVSGSVAAATDRALTIMVGGDAMALETARPVLEAMGKAVIHLGNHGAGASMKLSVNTVVHLLNGAVSEALVLAERSGIDRAAAYEVFRNSAIAAPFVHYRQAAFERPDETPVAFRLTLAAKDLRNALTLAEGVGASLPHSAEALRILTAAAEAGFADKDESAVAEYLRGADAAPGRSTTS